LALTSVGLYLWSRTSQPNAGLTARLRCAPGPATIICGGAF
jgi:hypothetical protein